MARCGVRSPDVNAFYAHSTYNPNVYITFELRSFIAAELSSGRHQTASEVVCAALRVLQETERTKPKPAAAVPPRARSRTYGTGA